MIPAAHPADAAADHYRERIAAMWHAGVNAALRGDADGLMATQAARILLRRAITAESGMSRERAR